MDKCTHEDSENFRELALPTDQSLSEYSYQMENGVLDMLRGSIHYTYQFFPSDDSKKDISLKVWQRPTFNWKLACEN